MGLFKKKDQNLEETYFLMFAENNPIKNNDHIDGLKDGKMSIDVQ